jgi:glycosyltransferase involved in cell wall biosynthesis
MTRKLLFAHDDRVRLDTTGRPISYNYTRSLIDRYRYLADTVTLAVRCEQRQTVKWYDDARIVCVPEMKRGLALARMHVAKRIVHDLVCEHDIVVARLPSLVGSWALRSAWKTNTPVLVEFVGCPWDALWNHSIKGKLVAPFFWFKNRRLMRGTSDAIYVTERFLQERYPTSGESISCSNVEVELAGVELGIRARRLSRSLVKPPIVLGTIANLNVRYKGQDVVMRAIASLGGEARSFIYRLIGPGDRGRLDSLAQKLGIQEQVEFVGGIEHHEIPDALDRIDVYIQPSLQEGLPRSMIEAMARGCVVIGARTGGIPELLAKEWVVPSGDWHSLARLLMDLRNRDLHNASLRNYFFAKNFELSRLNERRFEFYRRFLHRHGMAPAINGVIMAHE